MLWKIVKTVFMVFAVMVVSLILGGIYLYKGGTPSCALHGYNRFDWVDGGADQSGIFGESRPVQSIVNAVLMPDGVTAYTAFVRGTMLDNCALDSDNLRYSSYVELRSFQFADAVEAWRAGKNETTGFLKRRHIPGQDGAAPAGDGDAAAGVPDLHDVRARAPEWVDREQLTEAGFVAFWGSGYLLKSKTPGRFFWVGD